MTEQDKKELMACVERGDLYVLISLAMKIKDAEVLQQINEGKYQPLNDEEKRFFVSGKKVFSRPRRYYYP